MKISISLPNSLNKLTDWQLQKYAVLVAHRQPSVTLFLLILLVPKPRFFTLLKAFYVLLQVEAKSFLQHLEDFQSQPLTRFVAPFKYKGVRYFPPAPRLATMTIGEFAYADDCYYRYLKNNNTVYLDLLLAAICRPKGVGFSPYEVQPSQFSGLEQELKEAILLSWIGCRKHIAARFPLIFPKKNPNEAPSNYKGINTIVLQKARKGSVFGTLDANRQANLYDYLRDWTEDIEEYQKSKKQR